MNSKKKLISINNVNFIYNEGLPTECQALSGVNFELYSSEITSLIGHTGSGKSTLVQLLNGQRSPASGEIKWHMDGVCDQKGAVIKQKLCTAIGMVFQYPEDQVFEETVYDDIAFGPRQLAKSDGEIEATVLKSADLMGISRDLMKRSPFELSGGTLRKVAIAGVLAMKPQALVLDEPMAGLDPVSCDALAKLLLELRENLDISIVMVSHNLEYAAALSDRIYCMKDGRIELSGTPREVFSNIEKLDELKIGFLPAASLARSLKCSGIKFELNPINAAELVRGIIKHYGK